jgi:glycosyltransferase involved in cell wall biosynthesis
MNNKICIYAICKNEAHFVDKWYESMKEADEIIVVDTGSTDNTVEKLKQYPKIKVFEKTWEVWRFDEPRNYAMSLASDDVDIFFSTDLDEVLEPGWAKILKEKWNPKIHTRASYKYAWSHLPNGEPGRIFHYTKIHNKDWKWLYPVHEILARNGDCWHQHSETLDLFDEIYLHHYPDPTKSRGNYLSLLELRAEEFPDNDAYGKLYLAHEYYYRGQYNNCIKMIEQKLLPKIEDYNDLEQANIFLFLGDAYSKKQDLKKSIECWTEAIMTKREYREPYLRLASYYNEVGLFNLGLAYVEQAETTSKRLYSWLEQDASWTTVPNDIKAVAHYYLGHYDLAYEYGIDALKYEPDNTRLLNNLSYYKTKIKQKEE